MNLNEFLTGIGFFAKYPYTDFHALNLDWAITEIARLRIEFDDFAHVNSLKYAGEWDITKAYSAFSVVDDQGFGYMALKPVPPGTQINDTEYWLMVVDYSQIINDYETRITNLETTVGDASNGLVKDVDDLQNDLATAQSDIGALQGTVGDASSGLVKDVDDLQNDLATAQSDIGALQNTVGDASSGLIKEVDDIQTVVGDASSGLVKDVNDLKSQVYEDITVLVSDSYGAPLPTASWQDNYQSIMDLDNDHCIKLYAGGYCFMSDRFKNLITPGAVPESISADVDPLRVTKIVVCGGFNERGQDTSDVEIAINNFMQYAKTQYPNAKVYIGFIGWSFNKHYLQGFAGDKALMAYKNCAKYGATYLTNVEFIMHNRAFFVKDPQQPGAEEDYNYVHPNDDGAWALGIGIAQAVKGGTCSVEYPYIMEYLKDANPDMMPVINNFITEQLINDKVYVSFQTSNYESDTANGKYFNIDGYNRILLARLDSDPGYLAVDTNRMVPVLLRLAGGSGTLSGVAIVPGFIEFEYNNVYATFLYDTAVTCQYIQTFSTQTFVEIVH